MTKMVCKGAGCTVSMGPQGGHGCQGARTPPRHYGMLSPAEKHKACLIVDQVPFQLLVHGGVEDELQQELVRRDLGREVERVVHAGLLLRRQWDVVKVLQRVGRWIEFQR